MAGKGRKVSFHGAFATKAKALKKEAKVSRSFIRRVKIRSKVRYVVMKRRKS